MLQPKKTKYRKVQKGRMKGNSGRGHRLSNGMFGIKSLDSNFLTSRQARAIKKGSWIVDLVFKALCRCNGLLLIA